MIQTAQRVELVMDAQDMGVVKPEDVTSGLLSTIVVSSHVKTCHLSYAARYRVLIRSCSL